MCVSNKRGCPAWQYAESFGIPTLHWPEEGSEQGGTATAEQLLHALEHTYKADFVILAGFMKVKYLCTGGSMWLGGWSAAPGHSSCPLCSAQLLHCLAEGRCSAQRPEAPHQRPCVPAMSCMACHIALANSERIFVKLLHGPYKSHLTAHLCTPQPLPVETIWALVSLVVWEVLHPSRSHQLHKRCAMCCSWCQTWWCSVTTEPC